MSRDRPLALVAALCVALRLAAPLAACGGDPEATRAPTGDPGAATEAGSGDERPSDGAHGSGVAGASRGGPDQEGSGPAARDRVRVRYDLAAHVERAEIRVEQALVEDHGARGGAKYTLGGWLSGVADGLALDGEDVAVTTSTRARLSLPWDGSGDARVALRMRALVPGGVQVYVNGSDVGRLEPPADTLGDVELRVPEERLRRGENTLLLRTRRTARALGLPEAGLAIDRVTIAPHAAPPSITVRERDLVSREGAEQLLRLPGGVRLGYALEVPRDARLRGVLRAAAGTGLEVVAHRDGAAPLRLARVSGNGAGRSFDVDLRAVAGELVRLDLGASGGGVELRRPTVVTPALGETPAFRRPRNVLVYLVDTLRADKLGPYAPETRVRTPGLDRFVQTAATFVGAQAQENWTKPSVATLLSSLMPWQHTAVTGEAIVPASVTLLPEALQARGYYTGSFIANGYVSDRFGFRQGWDTYRNYIREGRRTQAEHVAADVLAWLDERPEGEPFFLYVHAIDPHVPYRPPQAFLDMYQPAPYRGPVSFRRDATLLENVKTGRLRLGEVDRRQLVALYDGEITYHDVHFGAIMDGLARRGLQDDTMIIVTSDHGEEFWDHGSVGHGHNVYQELLHVPFFVRLPGTTTAPTRVTSPSGLVDVVPTVLDALGEPIPPDSAGRSLLPLLLDRDEGAPRVAVSGFMEGWRTIVVGRHKLIHRAAEGVTLYDLVADPGETRDVAAERPIALRHARGLLGLALAATPAATSPARPAGSASPPRHEAVRAVIDPETRAQLEALGYVGTSSP